MDTLTALGLAWGVVTIAFIVLLLYRRRLTSNESDWIPLTDDAKEDQAIQAQTMIEMKSRKLSIPIRTLGALSVILLVVIAVFWFFHSLSTPPTAFQQ